MRYLTPWLCLATLVLCGDHDDISNQFGAARQLRTWDEAYALAKTFVAKLNTLEKISLSSGSGISFGPCSGNTQDIDRLGFREMCFQDGPVGVRGTDKVSVFPAGITTGSTWDKELIYLRSRAMGVENRLKGVNVALAPVAGGLGRAPAAGRNWEAFGSDPYLTGVANAESVKGLQDEGVIACAKHFVGNEQERYRLVIENIPNLDREILASLSSQIDERTLRELYEWPFVDAVEAGAGSVMCSYQRVNNEYSCESTTLIRDHLKSNASGGLNFKGFVMTDWFASAIPSLAARAGVDVIMPGDIGATGTVAAFLPASDGASTNGTRLDEMVIRLVASWYKMRQETDWPDVSFSTWSSDDIGVFLDRGYIGQINSHVQAAQPVHATLIRRIAAEGTTLLKNTGGLPLPSTALSIGVFGNDAGPIPESSCGTFGACSAGTLAVGWGSGTGTFEYLIDPLQAITAKAAEVGAVVESVLDDYAYTEIQEKAVGKDVCFAFVNSRSGEGTNSVEGNYGDRNNLTAWRDGDTLVKTVAASCSNTVVVIHSVGPILVEEWIENPNVTAVLLAHLPGQESGNSLVDVLWGDVNPSGKLPYTMGKTEDDYCCKVQYDWDGFQPEQEFSEGLFIDYKWFDKNNIDPRFEFGYGLSYTNFTYDAESLRITEPFGEVDSIDFMAPLFNISVSITNSGSVAGKEVAQLYLGYPSPTNSPVRQLRGFEKLSLQPGETKTAVFVVTKRDVSYWDSGEWKVARGAEYGVEVSASSRDVRAHGTVTF
ncbi:putative beta-glucosidase L [Morchella snyderi]|nr:putative beta-glucosidase L [Morchella snyderi]